MYPRREVDPLGLDVEVRPIQAYQATKSYWCPGCNQDIPPGTHHLVVVPIDSPDMRRHWHRPCWERRGKRRPGPVR